MRLNFKKALFDYKYLCERGYPPRGFLELVGNRYNLSHIERTMLYRGTAPKEIAKKRKQKQIRHIDQNVQLQIDGNNVITTVLSYLSGLTVYLSMDGFLRDAPPKRSFGRPGKKLPEAIRIILEYLKVIGISGPQFFLDQQATVSIEMKRLIESYEDSGKLLPGVMITSQVDRKLIDLTNGIVCTSDSGIIDQAALEIFDLAHHVIKHFFTPCIIDMNSEIHPDS
jgi:hypothetical protein